MVGIAIGSLTALRHGDLAYGLVFIWAYSGISLKHISSQYFNFRYPVVVYTAMGCIILMLLALIRILMRRIRGEKTPSGRVS